MLQTKKYPHVKNAFTLIELVVVMTIISIVAGFGIPNITKMMDRTRAREVLANVKVIHGANLAYKARNGSGIAATAAVAGIGNINSFLGINIIDNHGVNYLCHVPGQTCTATLGGKFLITVYLDRRLIANPVAPELVNPFCQNLGASTACD